MKSKTLRIIIPLALKAIIGASFFIGNGIGTLSAIGWDDVSLLCPLGALGTMLASKSVIPRAVVSLIITLVVIALLGRAFCAWVCPVPLVSRLRGVFSRKKPENAPKNAVTSTSPERNGNNKAGAPLAPLSTQEQNFLAHECKGTLGCSSCADARARIDTRHFVLGGSLLSAAIFGFPVFCLICPIGLTLATIMLVMLLFANGDVTWSVVAIPALLIVEVVLFRKWCTKICPLSALMSLVAKANKTFRPTIDDAKCLETSKGTTCGACARACEVHIDPRHPERGASWSECIKCRACVDVCPGNAVTLPFLPSGKRTTDVPLPDNR